jgi:hypothetical protein
MEDFVKQAANFNLTSLPAPSIYPSSVITDRRLVVLQTCMMHTAGMSSRQGCPASSYKSISRKLLDMQAKANAHNDGVRYVYKSIREGTYRKVYIVTSHHHTCLRYPDCFHVSCMPTFLIYMFIPLHISLCTFALPCMSIFSHPCYGSLHVRLVRSIHVIMSHACMVLAQAQLQHTPQELITCSAHHVFELPRTYMNGRTDLGQGSMRIINTVVHMHTHSDNSTTSPFMAE